MVIWYHFIPIKYTHKHYLISKSLWKSECVFAGLTDKDFEDWGGSFLLSSPLLSLWFLYDSDLQGPSGYPHQTNRLENSFSFGLVDAILKEVYCMFIEDEVKFN